MLPLNKTWDILNWARTIECIHRNQIGKYRRLKVSHVLLHSRRFILKHPYGLSTLKELIGKLIVDRKLIRIQHDTMA
ncbi:hypothetical protein D3C71_1235660 [compost metagenome]